MFIHKKLIYNTTENDDRAKMQSHLPLKYQVSSSINSLRIGFLLGLIAIPYHGTKLHGVVTHAGTLVPSNP